MLAIFIAPKGVCGSNGCSTGDSPIALSRAVMYARAC
jgi:hypothetical protein